MPASLQQLLAAQAPTASGIHEAAAQHAESIFDEFRGILPFFLGKRKLGPFINVTLPNIVTQDNEALLQTLGDFIRVYDLRLVSFVTAIRLRSDDRADPKLGALLITADNAKANFQLIWEMTFDSGADIATVTRTNTDFEIISREVWTQFFSQATDEESKRFSYERLVERFGGADQIPSP